MKVFVSNRKSGYFSGGAESTLKTTTKGTVAVVGKLPASELALSHLTVLSRLTSLICLCIPILPTVYSVCIYHVSYTSTIIKDIITPS